MALVFPPNPAVDDIYLGWRWDGAKWTYVSGVAGVAGVSSYNTRTGAVTSVLADVTTVTGTGATAQARLGLATVAATGAYADLSGQPNLAGYAPLAAPVFTGDARAMTPTYGDNDTSIATTAFVQTAVAPYQNNVGRNLLHNARFSINQRSYASGGALAGGAYGHDRWKAGASGCTYTFTQSQPSTTITITAGSLQQIIEAMAVEGGTYTLSWTGTAQGRVNGGSYAASPVTTAGLAINTAITIEFNTGTLGGIQLEIGSVATPLEKPDPQQDLAKCQRFYQAYVDQMTFASYLSGAGQGFVSQINLSVTMRAAPVVAFSGISYSNANTLSNIIAYTTHLRNSAVSIAAGSAYANYSMTLSADL